MWEVRTRVQVFRKEFHLHIYLDYVKVEFYFVKKKKKAIPKKKKKTVKIYEVGVWVICCNIRKWWFYLDMELKLLSRNGQFLLKKKSGKETALCMLLILFTLTERKQLNLILRSCRFMLTMWIYYKSFLHHPRKLAERHYRPVW